MYNVCMILKKLLKTMTGGFYIGACFWHKCFYTDFSLVVTIYFLVPNYLKHALMLLFEFE